MDVEMLCSALLHCRVPDSSYTERGARSEVSHRPSWHPSPYAGRGGPSPRHPERHFWTLRVLLGSVLLELQLLSGHFVLHCDHALKFTAKALPLVCQGVPPPGTDALPEMRCSTSGTDRCLLEKVALCYTPLREPTPPVAGRWCSCAEGPRHVKGSASLSRTFRVWGSGWPASLCCKMGPEGAQCLPSEVRLVVIRAEGAKRLSREPRRGVVLSGPNWTPAAVLSTFWECMAIPWSKFHLLRMRSVRNKTGLKTGKVGI